MENKPSKALWVALAVAMAAVLMAPCAARNSPQDFNGGFTGSMKEWPEVVGMLVDEAEKVIKKDMPEANIVVLPSGTGVTRDLEYDRVHIFVNTVCETPQAEMEPEGNKSSWPEVVGMSVEEAKEVILKDKPNAIIEVLTIRQGATRDLEPNRVRIVIDTVAETPFVG